EHRPRAVAVLHDARRPIEAVREPGDGEGREDVGRGVGEARGGGVEWGGGGSSWDGMAYDPEANLVYVGTGNGTPWSQDVRQGKDTEHLDNLYIASILAIDADSGQLKWHFQCTPADQWDYYAVQHLMLADLQIGGGGRKGVMQGNQNGDLYMIERGVC